MSFNLIFRGVRGSIPCAGTSYVRYGGNTSCIEVRVNDRLIILDAGTGIRRIGRNLINEGYQKDVDVLLTHSHWDHINGFPFFTPSFTSGYAVRVHAGHLTHGRTIRDIFAMQMCDPMSPIPLEVIQQNVDFIDFDVNIPFNLACGLEVKTASLNHPNGATGYRIEHEGVSFCYVTDTEHREGEIDANILELIDSSDLVIYDSTYTEEEYPAHKGWGHSTWNEGVRLCRTAEVKHMAIFHHSPDHNDDFMDSLALEAKREWEHTFVATENVLIDLHRIEESAAEAVIKP